MKTDSIFDTMIDRAFYEGAIFFEHKGACYAAYGKRAGFFSLRELAYDLVSLADGARSTVVTRYGGTLLFVEPGGDVDQVALYIKCALDRDAAKSEDLLKERIESAIHDLKEEIRITEDMIEDQEHNWDRKKHELERLRNILKG